MCVHVHVWSVCIRFSSKEEEEDNRHTTERERCCCGRPFVLAWVLRFVLIVNVVVELSTPFLLVVLRHATRRIVPSTCVVLKNTFFWFAPTDGDEEFSTWPVIDGIFVGGKDEPVSRKDSIQDVDTRRIRHSPPPAPTSFLSFFLSFLKTSATLLLL